jgi:hypothetical protein
MGEAETETAGTRTLLATGAISVAMPFSVAQMRAAPFNRADLIFTGVRHDEDSYEVRVFFNNEAATDKTKRTPQNGYAGKFIVLGHGGCAGAEGHCKSQTRAPDAIPALAGLMRGDPMATQTKFITVTEPLRRLTEGDAEGLRTVTLVVIVLAPRAADERMSAEALGFEQMRLETYL